MGIRGQNCAPGSAQRGVSHCRTVKINKRDVNMILAALTATGNWATATESSPFSVTMLVDVLCYASSIHIGLVGTTGHAASDELKMKVTGVDNKGVTVSETVTVTHPSTSGVTTAAFRKLTSIEIWVSGGTFASEQIEIGVGDLDTNDILIGLPFDVGHKDFVEDVVREDNTTLTVNSYDAEKWVLGVANYTAASAEDVLVILQPDTELSY